ncbi:hypothetical protein BD779DRAFT_1476866 [Infundibulicybe gibba]|nr:hypothetical protein BD779DRAFT_1476866 [Infundibulicybe gibba]
MTSDHVLLASGNVQAGGHWKGKWNWVAGGSYAQHFSHKQTSSAGFSAAVVCGGAVGNYRGPAARGAGEPLITKLHEVWESPYGDDAATARLEALSSAGVEIYFDLDSLSDFELSESEDELDFRSDLSGMGSHDGPLLEVDRGRRIRLIAEYVIG